jgi:hypothetical protein
MSEVRKVTKLAWRKFLSTEYGQEIMLALREDIPSINGTGDAHRIVFQAGITEGHRLYITKLLDLADVTDGEKPDDIENK